MPDKRQQEILQFLKDKSPPLEELYLSAIQMITDSRYPEHARIRLICHACREIINRLPEVLSSKTFPPGLQYSNKIKELSEAWDDEAALANDSLEEISEAKSEYVEVSRKFAKMLHFFFEAHKSAYKTRREKAQAIFEYVPENKSMTPDMHALVSHFVGDVSGWFSGKAHESLKHNDVSLDELIRRFNQFERTLHTIVGHYYTGFDEIREFVDEENQGTQALDEARIEHALSLIGRNQFYRYFFENLTNSEWLEPLKSREFFKDPPQSEEVDNSRTYRKWSPCIYLKAISGQLPKEVLDVIQDYDTDNILVIQDCLQALSKMPVDVAVQATSLIVRLVSKDAYREWHYVGSETAKLMVSFVESRYVDEAYRIAERLVAAEPNEDESWVRWNDLKGRYDPEEYNELIFEYYSALWQQDPIRAGALLIDLLYDCIKKVAELRMKEEVPEAISQKLGEIFGEDREEETDEVKTNDPTQQSYIPIPDLAKAEEKRPGIGEVLVSGIRTIGEFLIESGSEERLDQYLDYLREKDRAIFLRIELYLLASANFTAQRKERAQAILLEPEEYNLLNTEKEYQVLLHDKWNEIDQNVRDNFVQWALKQTIHNREDFDSRFEKVNSRKPSDEDIEQYEHKLKAQALYCIRNREKKIYDTEVAASGMLEEDVKPRPAGKVVETWVGTADKSPIAPENKSVEDFVKEVFTFDQRNPDSEEKGFWQKVDEKEALANRFKQDITTRPGEYVEIEPELILNLSPRFVRNYFYGIHDALTNRVLEQPNWNKLVDFILSCIEKKFFDPDCEAALQAIPRLFEKGFKQESCELPLDSSILERAFDVLRRLLEYDDGGKRRDWNDPHSAAINCVQGVAFEGIIRFALFVKNKDEAFFTSHFAERFQHTLDDVLSRPWKTKIHCAFGAFFGNLCWLVTEWIKKNLDSLFTENNGEYWDATWGCYIHWTEPYKQSFEIAKDKYLIAVQRIGQVNRFSSYKDNEKNLVDHLMRAYWHGWIDITSDITVKLMARANDDLMAEASQFLAEGFKHLAAAERGEWRDEVENRLLSYWKSRYKAIKGDPQNHQKEAEKFTGWLSHSPFKADQALDIAEKAVMLTGGTMGKWHDMGEFIEGACAFGEGNEVRVLNLINSVLSSSEVTHSSYIYKKKLEKFFEYICELKADYPNRNEILKAAIDIADRFGRLGLEDFRPYYDRMKAIG